MNLMLAQSQAQPWLDLLAADGITVVGVLLVVVVAFTTCLERLYEKSSNTGEPPRHEADHGSVHECLAARTRSLVIPRLILLFWSIQAIVRSTTHLLGNTKKPLGGISFCQSAFTPSLAHSLAHAISTSSGAGFRGRSTTSTLHPRVFLTQSAPLSSPL